MARLSEKVVQERESFLFKLFKDKPALTIPSAQEALTKKFPKQGKMRPTRVSQIKKEALGQAVEQRGGVPEGVVRARNLPEKGARKAPKGAPAPGYGVEAEAVSRAIKALQEIGARNVKITYDPPAREVVA